MRMIGLIIRNIQIVICINDIFNIGTSTTASTTTIIIIAIMASLEAKG